MMTKDNIAKENEGQRLFMQSLLTGADFLQIMPKVVQIAKEAAKIVKTIYDSKEYQVEEKSDKSPLTTADLEANNCILNRLKKEFSYPILSEEIKVSYAERSKWNTFWIVDPLDGTKDFVYRTGDFTVNIGLIENQIPVLGVIAVPGKDLVYYAARDCGAFKESISPSLVKQTAIRNTRTNVDNLIAVVSRFHVDSRTQEFLDKNNIKQVVQAGSALKFGLVAEGLADVYPRLFPNNEWDTAAGECIVREAGCKMFDSLSKEPMLYNKPSVLNEGFIVVRNNLRLNE